MATGKTLDRVHKENVWPNTRKDIGRKVKGCALCQVHQRRPDYVRMGEMPLANYPMQIGADLIGPFVNSTKDNRYVLTIIDHCTLWAEAYPLEEKGNKSVWQAWATSLLPNMGFRKCWLQIIAKSLKLTIGSSICNKAVWSTKLRHWSTQKAMAEQRGLIKR